MGRTYSLGSKLADDIFKDDLPAHQVAVSSFRIGMTLVTVGMWREYLRANQSAKMPKIPEWGSWTDDHPMINVTWIDIMGSDEVSGYCGWASKVMGMNLSLPTEAQWEHAAKAGQNYRYPWGNGFERNKIWCSTVNEGDARKTAPVLRQNRMHLNPFGVTDMVGNVHQWCFDAYEPYVRDQQDRMGYTLVPTNPKVLGSVDVPPRVVRGSAWYDNGEINHRTTHRVGLAPDYPINVGFRLVASA